MAGTLYITDDRARDAQIDISGPAAPPKRVYVGARGQPAKSTRLVKTTEGRDYVGLLRRYSDGEDLSKALVQGDPEIDLEQVGRRIGSASQVWIGPDGKVLYAARVLKVLTDATGAEVSRDEFVDVEATVLDDAALPWTGRLLPVDRVVRSFALVQKLQLHHINGLTFDFLHAIAKTLEEKQRMLVVGSGEKGANPLIFQRNGSPYRGFLEGRVDGEGYLLVLHLSNLELKRPVEAS
jgi:hypothetical protein